MRRVVSLFLPHWSTDRLRRKIAKLSPECRDGLVLDLPLVTAVPDHGRKVIAAVDAEAKALGVRVGMTVTKARAFAPELQVVDADGSIVVYVGRAPAALGERIGSVVDDALVGMIMEEVAAEECLADRHRVRLG